MVTVFCSQVLCQEIILIEMDRRHGNQEAFNMPVLIKKLPWHSLDKSLSKVVVSNSHLHLLVPGIRITVAQQHNLIQLHTYKCHYHSKNTDGSKY
jgi:hypothetical protein